MRIALALLAVLVVASPAVAEPSRAETVVDALDLDEPTAEKLLEVLTTHDAELDKLQRRRSEFKRKLVSAERLDPKALDRLLDDTVQNQRALAETELRLIERVRQVVPAPKAVHLLFLMSATEPERAPAVRAAPACNPFASMHGCRY